MAPDPCRHCEASRHASGEAEVSTCHCPKHGADQLLLLGAVKQICTCKDVNISYNRQDYRSCRDGGVFLVYSMTAQEPQTV
jgi:hypothetical protein